MKTPLVVAAMAAVIGFAETPPQSEAWFGALTGRNSQAVTEAFRAGPVVTGKPYSAMIVTRTAQQFANGTQIDHSETALVFRDAQGRTRVETDGGRSVTILDPVQNASFEFRVPDQTAKHKKGKKTAAHVAYKRPLAASNQWTVQLPKVSSEPEEKSLGAQMVNGVSATGTRTTSIIAVGAIGNDKELRIEAERWYSQDLQVLVKSTYNDPRFGTTTYELTRISRSAPDAALFQVPAAYEISENGGNIDFRVVDQTRPVYTPIKK